MRPWPLGPWRELPIELFPPLFTAAFAGRHTQALKAWPFPCLPLGSVMKDHQPHLETFQAALKGLDVLLAQEVGPRKGRPGRLVAPGGVSKTQPGQEDKGSPGNRHSHVQAWFRGRGDKRHVGPPVSLTVGTKGGPEAGGAVVRGVQSPRGVPVPVGLCTAPRVPCGPTGGEAAGAGLALERPPGLLDRVIRHQGQRVLAAGAEPAQPTQKRRRVEGSKAGLKLARAPMEVLVDLWLKEDTLDETLSYLLKQAKQRSGLLHLCCQELRIFTMPTQSIRRILKLVRLDSVQDLEVNCTWKLATVGRFVSHLGRWATCAGCCCLTATCCRTPPPTRRSTASASSPPRS